MRGLIAMLVIGTLAVDFVAALIVNLAGTQVLASLHSPSAVSALVTMGLSTVIVVAFLFGVQIPAIEKTIRLRDMMEDQLTMGMAQLNEAARRVAQEAAKLRRGEAYDQAALQQAAQEVNRYSGDLDRYANQLQRYGERQRWRPTEPNRTPPPPPAPRRTARPRQMSAADWHGEPR